MDGYDRSDQRQQQEVEEERFMFILGVLQRVKRGTSTEADALFLASELGLTVEYRQLINERKVM